MQIQVGVCLSTFTNEPKGDSTCRLAARRVPEAGCRSIRMRPRLTRCAGSPLGVFQEEPGTRRGLLSTVLRGGGSLVTPGVGAPVAPAGAVATVVRRDKPGMQPVISVFVSLCARFRPRLAALTECLSRAVPA